MDTWRHKRAKNWKEAATARISRRLHLRKAEGKTRVTGHRAVKSILECGGNEKKSAILNSDQWVSVANKISGKRS